VCDHAPMGDLLTAVILGVVEGLTEFLPVSSTGHLILVGAWLRFVGERAETFDIAIQLGAILAVAWLYRKRFLDLARDGLAGRALLPRRGQAGFTWAHIGLACLPAFVLGFAFHGFIRRNLFSTTTVLVGLVGGAVLMVAAELLARRRTDSPTATSLEVVTLPQALAVGCVQCLALWPGFSRSGSTISGGLIFGLDRRTAAELSFIVAVPVMLAATGYDLLKSWRLLDASFLATLGIGMVVSFGVAWLAVVAFLRLVQRVSLVPFAIYRVVVAAIYPFVKIG
jgi:undecaprenyl-diphosphatase